MKVSIILPIYNESQFIARTIDSIITQSYSQNDMELIISDGMSNDDTRIIVKNYQDKFPFIKLIDNPEHIVPTGFNRALNIAKGRIIIRVDGHTTLDKDYIKNCVLLLEKKSASNVGGLMTVIWKKDFDHVVSLATSSRFGIGNSQFHYSSIGRWVDTVYLGAWEKSIFNDLGGFDEELVRNQDDEFNFRILQSGRKIWLDPIIKSKYFPRNTISKLLKQYLQYGFYKVRVVQKRGGLASWRHLIPSLFVSALLVSLILINIYSVPFKVLLFIYFIANLIATVINIISEINPRKIFDYDVSFNRVLFTVYAFFVLPITYFILHFSYGVGTIAGLLFFWNKWKDKKLKDSLFIKKSEV